LHRNIKCSNGLSCSSDGDPSQGRFLSTDRFLEIGKSQALRDDDEYYTPDIWSVLRNGWTKRAQIERGFRAPEINECRAVMRRQALASQYRGACVICLQSTGF
jgi:hypothetical protein